ncbi:transposase [Spiroplasma sp. SV19]|uniref:transposase n=1 Tax=Spiroplasma sp. SV19 TaxID=2570468 RepID=UPI0024B8689C|nr:transposase [Spiroplasma sp. SV19]WHQ37510.1 hypothetical protein E7Y35_06670 [Spiroplasma sp. SV19]
MKHYTPDEKEKIVKEYLKNNITIKTQDSIYNISSVTLQKLIKNYKVYGENGFRNISSDQTTIKELEAKLRLSQQELQELKWQVEMQKKVESKVKGRLST